MSVSLEVKKIMVMHAMMNAGAVDWKFASMSPSIILDNAEISLETIHARRVLIFISKKNKIEADVFINVNAMDKELVIMVTKLKFLEHALEKQDDLEFINH